MIVRMKFGRLTCFSTTLVVIDKRLALVCKVIYITPRQERAASFIQAASLGIPQVRLAINPTKTHTNLPDLEGRIKCSHDSKR